MEAESKVLIVGIGNPLLDISVNDNDCALLNKYDLQEANAILAEEKHKPMFEEMWKNPDHQTSCGGAAMNSLRCSNFMMKAKYPGSCLYIGCIADDERGQQMESDAKGEGLDTLWAKTDETYTGACAVLIKDQERSLVADLGACLKYPTQHLKDNLAKLDSAKIFYLTSFFISSNFEALELFASYANEKQIPFAFNLSATFLIDIH